MKAFVELCSCGHDVLSTVVLIMKSPAEQGTASQADRHAGINKDALQTKLSPDKVWASWQPVGAAFVAWRSVIRVPGLNLPKWQT